MERLYTRFKLAIQEDAKDRPRHNTRTCPRELIILPHPDASNISQKTEECDVKSCFVCQGTRQ
jgi:hypothetical protein